MSMKGIKKVAAIFEAMQSTRQELIRMGSTGRIDQQDIRLAHVLEEMKDAGKVKFGKITTEKSDE